MIPLSIYRSLAHYVDHQGAVHLPLNRLHESVVGINIVIWCATVATVQWKSIDSGEKLHGIREDKKEWRFCTKEKERGGCKSRNEKNDRCHMTYAG